MQEPELRFLTTNSPFRSSCWAVIGWKGYVVAYCFDEDSAMRVWMFEKTRKP
jgi:hypothetical protein